MGTLTLGRSKPSTWKVTALAPWILLSNLALAEEDAGKDLYGELSLGYARIAIADNDYDTAAIGFRSGFYVEPQIGLEVLLTTGVTDDDISNTEVSLDYSASVMARFESPESRQEKVYLMLGYGVSSVTLERTDNGQETSETLDGVAFGGGAEYRFSEGSNHLINLTWQRNFENDGVKFDYTSIGYRFEF